MMNKFLIAFSSTMLILLAFTLAGCAEDEKAQAPATVPTAKELQLELDTQG